MIRSVWFVLAVLIGAPAFTVLAQDVMPNAMQGFGRDRKEPVKIEANSLEIRDRESYAIFEGNVTVKQGDSTMRAPRLKVYYEGSMTKKKEKDGGSVKAVQTTKDGKATNQRIKKIEALGGIIITAKDQKATGDTGVFDMPSNTATISGNVVISQGPNVMKADRVIVDLNTGLSRLESAGRVQGLFVPGSVKDKEPKK
jgi:lipopolysaccharide export system protein LptA